MKRHLIVGSRGSKLALTQTNWVIEQIKSFIPDLEVRVEVIKTQGDKILDVPLAKIGDKGLFVKEIEQALLEERVDIAVHSMKDMPTETPEGLIFGAVPKREDPADVLLSQYGNLLDLPEGAKLGSSSLRRRAQILNHRADLDIQDLRGNLDTRVQRLQSGDFDAIVVAAAGLNRLAWGGKRNRIPFDVSLPAVGQGALAVQCRVSDEWVLSLLKPLDDIETHTAITAERSLMKALQGGCQVPIGALAVPDGEMLRLDAVVASISGEKLIRCSRCDNMNKTDDLGKKVADELIAGGAGDILNELRPSDKPNSMGAAG